MTMTREELLSAISRSIDECGDPLNHGLAEQALQAIEDAGFMVVPVEPTEKMVKHGSSAMSIAWMPSAGSSIRGEIIPAIFKAMTKASPLARRD